VQRPKCWPGNNETANKQQTLEDMMKKMMKNMMKKQTIGFYLALVAVLISFTTLLTSPP